MCVDLVVCEEPAGMQVNASLHRLSALGTSNGSLQIYIGLLPHGSCSSPRHVHSTWNAGCCHKSWRLERYTTTLHNLCRDYSHRCVLPVCLLLQSCCLRSICFSLWHCLLWACLFCRVDANARISSFGSMQVLSGYFFFLRICDTPPAVVTLKKPESRGWWPRSFCMGCVSSKQFKRADAEHEDSSILAKETTCKNPFLQSLCVFLGVHLLTWPSCSLCEWSGGPPWVVQEDKPFHIQRWPDPQGAVGFSMWSKSRNWPCDSQASNFCLSVFSCRRSSSLLSSGTVTRRTFSPIGSVPTLMDVSLSCRISIY